MPKQSKHLITEEHSVIVTLPEGQELHGEEKDDELVYQFPPKCILRHEAVSRWQLAVWALLGLLIVAHGCHANRDTELLARPAVVGR